jgi:capsular exopolysaccharide synthesis family protein
MINFSQLLWKQEGVAHRRTASAAIPGNTGKDYKTWELPAERVTVNAAFRVAFLATPDSPGADRFRLLRMRLRELKNTSTLQSLVITSPLPRDGKSTITLNLATALAQGGNPVLVIEADFHHPTLAQTLGLSARSGLAECLEHELDSLSQLRYLEPLNWHLLQAGKPRGNPSELLHADTLRGVLQRLSPYFEWILIDAPPIAPLTDALSLSRQADASMVVVRADRTPLEAVDQALTLLGPKRVLGIILNGAEGLNRLYSEYYGSYSK